jgi:hypothetical protein
MESLWASNLQALPLLQRWYESGRFHQPIPSARVQLSEYSAHDLDIELLLLQIAFVNVGYLQLSPLKRHNIRRYITTPAGHKNTGP